MSETPRPRGRPTVYDHDVAMEIVRRIGEGESLRAICRDEGMPSEGSVRGWVIDNREGFAAHYTQARMSQAVRWGEEILEIADDASNDWMASNKPDSEAYVLNGEHTRRSHMRIEARKWLLSKVLPKVYGDKLDLRTEGDGTINVTIRKFEGDQ